jgi:hypothetical protein
MIAKKNLVLTNDRTRVVEDGDPDGNSGFRIALAGEVVPDYVVEKYGLAAGELAEETTKKKPQRKQTDEGA